METNTDETRARSYEEVRERIESLLGDEDDWVAAMATVVAELHHSFPYFHWTGFYRVIQEGVLAIGPYQGGHGCLRIPFEKGVCGAAARSKKTQRIEDVTKVADHIACSATTRSEIVVPLLDSKGFVVAVLDVDSDDFGAFSSVDEKHLESLCVFLGNRYF